MIYTFKDGTKVEVNKDELNKEYIKVNLPATKENYDTGNGEGVFAKVTAKDYEDWQNDKEDDGNIRFAFICNDSVYYDGLIHGSIVPIELRGDCRPVAILEELVDKFGEANHKRIEMIMSEMIKRGKNNPAVIRRDF